MDCEGRKEDSEQALSISMSLSKQRIPPFALFTTSRSRHKYEQLNRSFSMIPYGFRQLLSVTLLSGIISKSALIALDMLSTSTKVH